MDFSVYQSTFGAIYIMLLTVFIQSIVAGGSHRAQKSYIPGIVSSDLGHESFVFRSHRTFMNSVENIPFMIGLITLAIFCGFSPFYLSLIVWTYTIARIIHMALYYSIATEKNPSPRSYFFMIAVFAQLVLLVMLGKSLFLS
jgi:uncharacterized MAPEG superfamily protein